MTRIPDPKFPAPMSFDVSAIRFPEIVQNKDNIYGVAVPWKDLPATLAEVMAEQVMKAKSTTWGVVNIRSGRVPRLYAKSGDINDLIVFRQRVETMNMTLETALIGVPATLHVVFWEKTRHGSAGEIGVSLNALTIDPAAISLPGPLDDHPHK